MLPTRLYTADQVKTGEVLAAKVAGIEMYTLMTRAGQAVFDVLRLEYPECKTICVVCGGGNNGGDGYVVARLALIEGFNVRLVQHGTANKLSGDAATARDEYIKAGGLVSEEIGTFASLSTVIIDALLGTGLKGEVRQSTATLIHDVNSTNSPVIAIDIPSGLCSDTGTNLGETIIAAHTVSFIGLKQGLMTGSARDFVGKLHFAGLNVDKHFDKGNVCSAEILQSIDLENAFMQRTQSAHKGSHGKALLVGGNEGMGGAILITGSACVRTGCGLTAMLTDRANLHAALVHTPEVMSGDWGNHELFEKRLSWANVLAFGPGFGLDEESEQRFLKLSQSSKSKVVDADALTFLANHTFKDDNRIITPHPGEAAKLLDVTVKEIESDRYQAIKTLQRKYGGIVILKGAGTLVCDGGQVYVCAAGNPGMASGGMGDLLTGILVSLLAQRYSLSESAKLGVLLHSVAADVEAKKNGEIGLLASDLLPHIRRLVNNRNVEY